MSSPSYLTPPVVAQRYRCRVHNVLAWIRRGELRAVNTAARPNGRPRWRISEADLLDFERRRSARPPAPVARRRRRDLGIKEYV